LTITRRSQASGDTKSVAVVLLSSSDSMSCDGVQISAAASLGAPPRLLLDRTPALADWSDGQHECWPVRAGKENADD
jgi:hypothetical protein